MTLWMVRGGGKGEYEQRALDEGLALISFEGVGNLSGANSREDIEQQVRQAFPEWNDNKTWNVTGQLHAFVNRMEAGDLVAMPLKTRPHVALGRVLGPYQFQPDLPFAHHGREVDWQRPDVPRSALGQDLLYSLGAFMTVCQIRRNDAEERFTALLAGGTDPGFQQRGEASGAGSAGDEDETEGSLVPDIEQLATGQILAELEVRFKGHDLARLVEATLRAQGYFTDLSPPGPDGGVDVLAGRGPLGLDGPKICVQVKSLQRPVGVNVLRELQGSMSTFKADQGLLVSWSGFTTEAQREARHHHFSLRLWEASDLLEAVVENYDRLPEEMRNDLPLKRIWALVLED